MTLLQMSGCGALLILAVIVIRAVALNRLPKKTFLVLWAIVLLRLLLPFSLPSPLSAYSLVNSGLPTTGRVAGTAITTILPVTPVAPPAVQSALPLPVAAVPPYRLVWLAGMVGCALFFGLAYLRCRREFRESLPVRNDYLTRWLADHPLGRTLAVRQSDRIAAPLTYGVLRPVILFPKNTDWQDDGQIGYILAHEWVHIHRLDAATKLLLTAAVCIHWFNPLVWVMYTLANRDIELCCDESVIRTFGEPSRSGYARTLIGMEETKSTLTPLCNNFSKNAIEERITAIMRTRKTTLLAVLVAVLLVVGVTVAFATSASPGLRPLQPSGGKNVGDYERQKLVDFQFSGYQQMTVADYQQQAWALMDTGDYRAVLERIWQNNMFMRMRYNNNSYADFLFNLLGPLTGEQWQRCEFSHYAERPTPEDTGNGARLEYSLTLTIQNPNGLTVGQYNAARQGMMDDLEQLLQSKTDAELGELAATEGALAAEVERLTAKWSSDALQVEASCQLMLPAALDGDTPAGIATEERPYPPATAADLQSLLALRTADYRRQSVLAFNAALLEWANADFERSERISIDRAWDSIAVPLTAEERSFVTLTAWLSGEENTNLVRSEFSGAPPKDPTLGGMSLTKEVADSDRIAFVSLYYLLSYHIDNPATLTVGERDRAVAGVIDEIRLYWDNNDLDTLLEMDADQALQLLQTIAAKHSTPLVRIYLEPESVTLEKLNEPIRQ